MYLNYYWCQLLNNVRLYYSYRNNILYNIYLNFSMCNWFFFIYIYKIIYEVFNGIIFLYNNIIINNNKLIYFYN